MLVFQSIPSLFPRLECLRVVDPYSTASFTPIRQLQALRHLVILTPYPESEIPDGLDAVLAGCANLESLTLSSFTPPESASLRSRSLRSLRFHTICASHLHDLRLLLDRGAFPSLENLTFDGLVLFDLQTDVGIGLNVVGNPSPAVVARFRSHRGEFLTRIKSGTRLFAHATLNLQVSSTFRLLGYSDFTSSMGSGLAFGFHPAILQTMVEGGMRQAFGAVRCLRIHNLMYSGVAGLLGELFGSVTVIAPGVLFGTCDEELHRSATKFFPCFRCLKLHPRLELLHLSN